MKSEFLSTSFRSLISTAAILVCVVMLVGAPNPTTKVIPVDDGTGQNVFVVEPFLVYETGATFVNSSSSVYNRLDTRDGTKIPLPGKFIKRIGTTSALIETTEYQILDILTMNATPIVEQGEYPGRTSLDINDPLVNFGSDLIGLKSGRDASGLFSDHYMLKEGKTVLVHQHKGAEDTGGYYGSGSDRYPSEVQGDIFLEKDASGIQGSAFLVQAFARGGGTHYFDLPGTYQRITLQAMNMTTAIVKINDTSYGLVKLNQLTPAVQPITGIPTGCGSYKVFENTFIFNCSDSKSFISINGQTGGIKIIPYAGTVLNAYAFGVVTSTEKEISLYALDGTLIKKLSAMPVYFDGVQYNLVAQKLYFTEKYYTGMTTVKNLETNLDLSAARVGKLQTDFPDTYKKIELQSGFDGTLSGKDAVLFKRTNKAGFDIVIGRQMSFTPEAAGVTTPAPQSTPPPQVSLAPGSLMKLAGGVFKAKVVKGKLEVTVTNLSVKGVPSVKAVKAQLTANGKVYTQALKVKGIIWSGVLKFPLEKLNKKKEITLTIIVTPPTGAAESFPKKVKYK